MADDEPQDYEALIAALNSEIAGAQLRRSDAQAELATLDEEQKALGQHPHYARYRHGGIAAVRDMGFAHILAHAGFYLLRYGEATVRLAEARGAIDDDCLILALKLVCESDPLLEVAGLAWLGEQGLLKRGTLDPFWSKRPKLGLGTPAGFHGLTAEDADAHRGLYTLAPSDLHDRFRAVARTSDNTFGDLLPAVIATGGAALAAIGAAASEADAAERYWAKCASFAAHQRANGDRRWRWKPPNSRQGHHAVTIARLNDAYIPAERTRGHAATWLDDNGANPRFRKD